MMNETEDVLVKWAEWISEAIRVGEWGDDQDKCIRDLAAEVQSSRDTKIVLRSRIRTLVVGMRAVRDELESWHRIADLRSVGLNDDMDKIEKLLAWQRGVRGVWVNDGRAHDAAFEREFDSLMETDKKDEP